MLFSVQLQLTNYIAQPYWEELELAIRIEKDSGANRQKSEDKRRAAITAQCDKIGLSYLDYQNLLVKSKEKWNIDKDGNIYIPRHKVAGMMVQAIGQAPKALRGDFSKDNFRSIVHISDFTTDRKEKDGDYSRFVKNDATNMRRLQVDQYIGIFFDRGEEVEAVGMFDIDSDNNKVCATVKALLENGLTKFGCGSCRKMGFGLGELISWQQQG